MGQESVTNVTRAAHPQSRAARSLVVNEAQAAALRNALRGQLVLPGSPAYDSARRLYNAMIDKSPALIAQCIDADDVRAALAFAHDHDLEVAIRCGGHNGAGLGSVDGGLVIDLSPMKGIQVDPDALTVRVEGGCTLGEVDRATQAFGLATPCGVVSTTGVGGLTLGGGLGHLTRQWGLTIDNLLEADVVLADGRRVTASAAEHDDLFWALRGGGGNFGVVTSFKFRLHRVQTIHGGPMLWRLDQAAEVMRWYRAFIANAPETINGLLTMLQVPPAPPFPAALHRQCMCGLIWCYTGASQQAAAVFAAIRQACPPALDLTGPFPYAALQSLFDDLLPAGYQWYWRGDFFSELSDEAIARHVEYGARVPNIWSSTIMFPVNGAAHRVGQADTAFSYRDALWAEVVTGVDPDPANADQVKAWTIDYWDALHPFAMGSGAYVNFLMDEGHDRVRATYRDNYARLAEVKQRYDPDNFFHINQNIAPAGSAAPAPSG